MPDKLRIAVVGLGRIGWDFHITRLQQSPEFMITAVTDPEPDRRQEAEAAIGCATFADYDEMLAATELDAVVIATPTHLHEQQALAALDRGLHVLLEKPMALDAAEAERIFKAADRTERIVTVYQPHRLAAYFQTLKTIVGSGRLGRICMAQIGMFSFSRRNDWQSLKKYGGGMLNNYGAHGLDQILQLVGYDIQRSFCALQQIATLGDTDDAVKIVLQTTGGAIGELDISQASAIYPYRVSVWGNCGGATYHGNKYHVRWFDPAQLPPKQIAESLASPDRRYPSDQIDWQEEEISVDEAALLDVHANFAAAIRGQADVIVPPQDTLRLMCLLERLRENSSPLADLRP